MRNLVGGSEYRERLGVIRMAVGQLGFTPDEMQTNIKAFMDAIKKDMSQLGDRINKEIHEVVCHFFPKYTGTIANTRIGPELNECARLHAQW